MTRAYSYIFFDVAGTLLQKKGVYEVIQSVLSDHGIHISLEEIRTRHILLSQAITFPDKTSKQYYDQFNTELCYSFGVLPNMHLLDALYYGCTRISWSVFDDTRILFDLPAKKGVLSNWDMTLDAIIQSLFQDTFSPVLGSEKIGMRKPDKEFFRLAAKSVNIPISEIAYVGDSIKLDMEPAKNVGFEAILIDRYNTYPGYTGIRIKSLTELVGIV